MPISRSFDPPTPSFSMSRDTVSKRYTVCQTARTLIIAWYQWANNFVHARSQVRLLQTASIKRRCNDRNWEEKFS